ncbi:Enterobactin outer-membrane receptor [Sphingobacterium mizutaii]|uniref:Enterobactin outer-membrane receptor n=1 Tax=Sphingobacterium mizutaii TaxID=1010 RepID=A0AAJ4XCB3_9SPHI|nr:TonB-dependent receptor [Sphingobacterium mizutaii]SDK95202.1 TonB-linked outer membrane protein, SusC/RagA family [Sphingobacterium mizutaii]SNV48719.1 Enterobactin outer-membrane receptor [Sphingobacterium mizutaii]
MMQNLKHLLVLLYVFVSVQVQAQGSISGLIKDRETGNAIIGATITSSSGIKTSSGPDGKFSINLNPNDKSITISFVGYELKTESIDGREFYDITLTSSENALNEVVVIGYGTAKRSDITGAVSSLNEKDFNKGVNTSPEQLLAGKVAGVQVVQSSGEPGGGISVNIRGMGSINASNSPLYVVDGFPIDNSVTVGGTGANFTGMKSARNPLNAINPNDIASIEVLKDASATAIYGSRGANGVVMITTKRGKTGGLKVDYDGYYGVQNVQHDLDILNAEEYRTVVNAIIDDGGGNANQRISDLKNTTDWLGMMYNKNAPIQNHNLSFSGGNEQTKYHTSLNYYNQDGLLINSNNNRYSARLNLEHTGSIFKLGANMTSSFIKDNYVANGMDLNERAGIIYAAIAYDPTLPIYNENGGYMLSPDMNIDNPLAIANGKTSISNLYRTLGTIYGEINFLNDFTAKLNLGADISNQRRDTYVDRQTIEGRANGGIASILQGNSNSYLAEFTLGYKKTIDIHDFNFLLGITGQQFNDRAGNSQGSGFSSDATKTDNMGLGDPTKFIVSSSRSRNSLLSYLGRANYNLLDKYLFTASLRIDGSSRFGENNQYGVFPSFAFGWKLDQEDFIKSLDIFNSLKLRASWGRTGNQEIGNYQSMSTYAAGQKAVIGEVQVSTTTPSRLPNPNLKWETSEQLNFGLDFSIVNSRLSGSLDYFFKDTKDMLLNLAVPRTTGFSTMMTNIGAVRNSGFELMLNSVNLKGSVNWETNLNLAWLKNEVLDLGSNSIIYSGSSGGTSNISIIQVGLPMYSFYGYQIDGIWQKADDFSQTNDKVVAGDIKYRDINGDKIVNADDRVVIGNSFPKYTASLTNNIDYKNFNLNIFIDGVFDVDMLNNNLVDTYFPANLKRNRIAEPVLNRWTENNPSTQYPSFVNPNGQGKKEVNTYTVEDASYIRLSTVKLGYTFPLQSTKYVKGLNVFLVGQNLAMITKYSGYDPTINPNGSGARIDWNAYPTARTFMLGVNLSL